jgi:vacuolar-type H+-ATPase subunit I/STV1
VISFQIHDVVHINGKHACKLCVILCYCVLTKRQRKCQRTLASQTLKPYIFQFKTQLLYGKQAAMSQCSIELQTITPDSQLQTLISRVAGLENHLSVIEHKLDKHIVTQAVSNRFTSSDNTTATYCETKQIKAWKPTTFIAMFEQIIDRIKRLESPVASIAVLGTMVDENSNVRLQTQDCLTQLESQFNERMANLKTCLK